MYSRQVLKPDTRLQNLKYWRSLYNRFDSSVNSEEKTLDRLLMIKNHTTSLNDYAKLLEKRCAQLKTLIKTNTDSNENDASDLETSTISKNSIERESSVSSLSSLTLDQLTLDFNSIQLNWKSNLNKCSCSSTFDAINYKLNCLKCGDIYCEKCIEDGKYVNNHLSSKLIFICKKCLN